MTFRVVVTGYNCERWAAFCLQSIFEAQHIHEVFIYVVNDGSTDRTKGQILSYINRSTNSKNIHFISYQSNVGAAFARWQAIEKIREHASQTDVLVFVDLDDYVLPNIFDVLALVYEKHFASVTYGNWQDSQTGKTYEMQYYTKEIAEGGRFINVPFHATAPRTCLWYVAQHLKPSDFIYEGVWLHTCTDVALMFSLFSLVGFREIYPIETPLYVYRQNTGNNSLLRFGFEEKIRVSHLILHRYENYSHNRS